MTTEQRSELVKIAALMLTRYQIPEDINEWTTYRIGIRGSRQITSIAKNHNDALRELSIKIYELTKIQTT